MAILLAGAEKSAREIAAAASEAGEIAVIKDWDAETVAAGTSALVFTVGSELAELPDFSTLRGKFEALKEKGISIILSFNAFPQKEESWLMYWAMVLPFVDLVVMPFADALKMFENDVFARQGGAADAEYCATVSLSMINLGCAAVLFTLDKDGLYLRTSSVHPRLASMGALAATSDEAWWAREIYRPGSVCPLAAAAGLLAGLSRKETPEKIIAGIKSAAGAPAESFAGFKAENDVFIGKYNRVEA